METLADRISRDGPLNELDAVGWAIRLAKRIEALHALGVAHGSISPACVITTSVDRTGKGVLVDVRHTPSRLAYQSPERAAGGDLSPADDVWAIAATLYEMLTGTPAFAGANDAETRQRVAGGTPAPLAVFDVGDDDLQHILDSAFQRDPAARTRSAAALRKALEEWHPDRGVRSLSPLEDEDSTNDDDDDVRTVMRAPAYTPEPPRAAPAARPAAGQPAAPRPAAGQPAAPRSAAGQPAAPYAAAPAPAPQQLERVSNPLLDDDDDNAATVMREYPMQRVLENAARVGAPPPAAGQPAAPRAMPSAAATRSGGFAPAPAAAPAYAAPAHAAPAHAAAHEPPRMPAGGDLGSTVALDIGASPAAPDAPWAPGAPGRGPGLAHGLPADLPDDDEDDVRTVMREGPNEAARALATLGMQPRPDASLSSGFGPPGAAPAPQFGASPPAAFAPQPGAAPPPGAFPGAPMPGAPMPGAPMPGAPGAPGAPPQQGGLLGPSPVDGFGRGQRAPGPGGAPAPFSQPTSGAAAPSPFAAPGPGGLYIPDPPPPRSPWRAVIILLVVAIVVGAGVAILAMNTGALG